MEIAVLSVAIAGAVAEVIGAWAAVATWRIAKAEARARLRSGASDASPESLLRADVILRARGCAVMPSGAANKLSLAVSRDYSRPEFPRFLVASDDGPLTPEDYVSHYAERLGWKPALRTQNDCWEVLAGLVAGSLVPEVRYPNGCIVTAGFARRWPEREYSIFRKKALRLLASKRALTSSWRDYRASLSASFGGRRLLDSRGSVVEAFIAELVPRFVPQQLFGIVDLQYRLGTVSGMPDVCFIRDGSGGFIEVKAPGDSIRERQNAVHDLLINELGISVWTCELRDESPSDSPEAIAFKEARAIVRKQRKKTV